MEELSNTALIPEGYVVAPGWKVGPRDITRGPDGQPTLILVNGGRRITIGSLDTAFIAVELGVLVKKEA